MPNIKSAIKRVNQTESKNARNRAARTEVANVVKKVRAAVESNDLATAKELLPLAYKTLDQAASNGVIHANNASNKKSSLAKLVNDLETGKLVIAAKVDNKTRIAEKKAKEAAEKEIAREAAKKAAAEKEAKIAAKKSEEKPAAKKSAKKADEAAPEATEAKPAPKKAPAKKAAAEDGEAKPAAKKAPAKKAPVKKTDAE